MAKIIKKNRKKQQNEAITDKIPEIKAFEDPDFHLLASFDIKDKYRILRLRSKNNVTIKDAIALFKTRQKELDSLKQAQKVALKKSKKKKTRSDTIKSHGGVISSLQGVTSARTWNKTK